MKTEEARKARRLEAEEKTRLFGQKKELRLLEAEKAEKERERIYEKEMKILEAEGEKEETERNRMSELKKTWIEVNLPHGLKRGDGVRECSGESHMMKSLKLIPEFDEKKVTEWSRRFENKAAEFNWPQERWVGLVANMLKGKALKVYDWMAVEDLEDHEELKTS